MTKSETILQALLGTLAGISAEVRRNDGFTHQVPASGLVVVFDGDPGDPEVTMSPLMYHYEHRAEIEVFAQDADDREGIFDAVKAEIGAALLVDRTLGGLCDWVQAEAPKPQDVIMGEALPIKAATIGVMLMYSATDPLN